MNIPKVYPKEVNYRGGYWKGEQGEMGRKQIPSNFLLIQEDPCILTLLRLFDLNDFSKLDENGRSYLLAGSIYHGITPKAYAALTADAENAIGNPGRYVWYLVWILMQLKRESGYIRVKWRCLLALQFADDEFLSDYLPFFKNHELIKNALSEHLPAGTIWDLAKEYAAEREKERSKIEQVFQEFSEPAPVA